MTSALHDERNPVPRLTKPSFCREPCTVFIPTCPPKLRPPPRRKPCQSPSSARTRKLRFVEPLLSVLSPPGSRPDPSHTTPHATPRHTRCTHLMRLSLPALSQFPSLLNPAPPTFASSRRAFFSNANPNQTAVPGTVHGIRLNFQIAALSYHQFP